MDRIFLAFILLVAGGMVLLPAAFAVEKPAAKGSYTCPMHPDYVADKPGSCPICGMDLKDIERIGIEIEMIIKSVPGTRSTYAERVNDGYFLDFNIKRDPIARYGLSVQDVQETISSAIGGETVRTTVEGPERYSVNVRYLRELRSDVDNLNRILVATPSGAHLPLSLLADLERVEGPLMIRNENGMRSGYVYVDVGGRDMGGFVEEAKAAVAKGLELTPGYSVSWSGQYENMVRVKERLKVVVPLTIFLIFLLLFIIPIMWSFGAGADIIKRIAAPMIGGIFSSFALELLVYPAVYFMWKWHTDLQGGKDHEPVRT